MAALVFILALLFYWPTQKPVERLLKPIMHMEKLLLANKILKKDLIQEGITIYSKITNQLVAR